MSKKSSKRRIAMNGTPKWKRFESLVGKIQQELAPDATIILDDKIMGQRSRTLRQIDISIRRSVGQFEILIIVDCKDYAKPVDVKGVEDFLGLTEDVGANKGALVSSSGFTKAAKIRAKDAGIDVYRLVDAEDHNWRSYITLPIVCDFRGLGMGNFAIHGTKAICEELTQHDPKKIHIYDQHHEYIGSPLTLLWAMWNRREISEDPGFHEISLKPYPIFVKARDGHFEWVEIVGNFEIVQKLYFGGLPLTKVSGFMDEITGKLILPGNFEIITDFLDVVEVEHTWQPIPSIDSLAVKPFAVLTGFDRYPITVSGDMDIPEDICT
jgi:hypothetical protein